MKQKIVILFALMLLITCRPTMAQTSFQDLPVEFRKNGYPQLVEECKDVLKAAYMAQNKLGTFYDIPNWEGYPVELWEYFTGEDIKKHVKKLSVFGVHQMHEVAAVVNDEVRRDL